jgi:uncharacterized protein (TIGR03067 family)
LSENTASTFNSFRKFGIYKLDGDTLTVCFAGAKDKGKRPTEFAAPEGTGRRIEILKREKP